MLVLIISKLSFLSLPHATNYILVAHQSFGKHFGNLDEKDVRDRKNVSSCTGACPLAVMLGLIETHIVLEDLNC